MSLAPALKTAIGNLRSGGLEIEEDVKKAVIEPILRALGWDTADLRSTKSEYPTGDGRVDYALLDYRRPLVFIEAKRRGALDVRAEAQLFRYAAHNGVPLLVLTDGYYWDLYLSMEAGPPEDRRFCRLELRDAERVPDYAEILDTFLRREHVESGTAKRNAEESLHSDRERQRTREAIPGTWNALLTEPDEFLRDLLAERVHDKTGAKPELSDVEFFLTNLTPASLHPATAQRPPIQQSGPPSGESRPKVTGGGNEPKSGNFEERRRKTAGGAVSPPRNGLARGGDFQAIVYDLMRIVLETHPELLDEKTISYLEKERNPFGTKLAHPLIRKISEGRAVYGSSRYKKDEFAGQWHVCTEWNKPHVRNARAFSEWVESLTARANSPEARDCLESILRRLSSWEEKHTS